MVGSVNMVTVLTDEDMIWLLWRHFRLCKTKVLESNSNNSVIFEQREIFGIDLYTVISQFTKVVLISENIVKYKFNEHWNPKTKKYSENVIGFIKTINLLWQNRVIDWTNLSNRRELSLSYRY